MTPSINRLAETAKTLGEYIANEEWDLIIDEFVNAEIATLDEFATWIQGFRYYEAVICICGGNAAEIIEYLTSDYTELAEIVRLMGEDVA
jgi:hypothetical protein